MVEDAEDRECIMCGDELEPKQKRFCGVGCRRRYHRSIVEGSEDDFSRRLRDGFGATDYPLDETDKQEKI